MRVAFWLTFTVALILGALYGVGYFLLPNTLDVTRSVSIDRPRAAVFAMANDLKIAKEWSPYYARDPDAEYSFSGEGPGSGQAMHWISTNRQVGSGGVTIVRSTLNREVDTIIQLGDSATFNGRMMIQKTTAGSSAAWTVSAVCQAGWINIPCRYMNLALSKIIEKDLDDALARLKTQAQQLPNVDFEGLAPEFLTVSAQPFVYSAAQTSASDQAEVDRALAMGVDAVRRFMAESAMTPAGPMVRQTTAWNAADQRMSFNVGYPYSGPTPLTVVNVQIGQTPSGQAMKVVHTGPRETVADTYAKAFAFLQAHRIALREQGLPWEVVSDGSDGAPASTRIEIYIPLQ
ncbi:MAG: GyrI-like domain-containing protein [Caulobacterales bacterium]